MSIKTKTQLLSAVASLIRTGGTPTKTKAADVRSILTDLIDTAFLPEAFSALTFGATTTWDAESKPVSNKILLLTGNTTLVLTGLVNGQCGTLDLTASANCAITLPAGSVVQNGQGGPILINSGEKRTLMYYYNGTELRWSVSGNFNAV